MMIYFVKALGESILYSYTQLFFCKHKTFGFFLIIASFFDWKIGISGFIAVLITNLLAYILGFPLERIKEGLYSTNSLLVGFALAQNFQMNEVFFLVLFTASLLSFLVRISISNILSKVELPPLSLPFTISLWIILLATREYKALEINEGNIYLLNKLYAIGGIGLVDFYTQYAHLAIPDVLEDYLKSLGAIVFQFNVIAGSLIAVGLLVYSRIAFLLSIIGFLTGYSYYTITEGNLNDLHYALVGFNFMLSGIAIGGFFLVPSKSSYLLVVVITPVIAMLINALEYILLPYQLGVLSMPFCIIVMMVLFLIKSINFQEKKNDLRIPLRQASYPLRSPEETIYRYKNDLIRYANIYYYHIALPYQGFWNVWQGYDGAYTHKGAWQHALDFVIKENDKTYKDDGYVLEDYYCYLLPVLAVADGEVVNVVDGIEDNPVGGVNLIQNWGNAVVIKHAEGLYSEISHFKKDTIAVKIGDFVRKGQYLGLNGNSGRSPEPHIHFQMQTTPYIGSGTLPYPISYFIRHKNRKNPQDSAFEFCSFQIPNEEDIISNVQTTEILQGSFGFVAGQNLVFMVKENTSALKAKVGELFYFNVLFDYKANLPYLYCAKTHSTAYFVNNGVEFYFTLFYGKTNSVLYHLYLAMHKVVLGYYEKMVVKDYLPASFGKRNLFSVLQDCVAPFYIFMNNDYELCYQQADNPILPQHILLKSSIRRKFFGKEYQKIGFEIHLRHHQIQEISMKIENKLLRLDRVQN